MSWKNSSQEELDKQYSPSKWVKEKTPEQVITDHVNLTTSQTQFAKQKFKFLKQQLLTDKSSSYTLFYKDEISALLEIIIYIHGGYWTAGVLEDSGAFFAKEYISRTCGFVTLEYKLSPPNNISQIYQSVEDLVIKVIEEFPKANINIIGHSAGAHLAALLFMKKSVEANYLLVSGIYDLAPIKSSCVNKESNLDLCEEDIKFFSPRNFQIKTNQGFSIGRNDSPEFQRQSKEFHEKINNIISSEFYCLQENHFSIIESFSQKNSLQYKILHSLLSTLQ
eukprot:snap_masked-scaffold_48-processed-gene-1.97-mRNA-1 protein AED:1.00 eAED:1.00 QI:0/0/0/0/1/1/2/0/278